MKLDKKQLPQLVALGVLMLGSVGYVSFTVLRPKKSARVPAPVVEARQETDGSGGAADSRPTAARQWQMVVARTFPDLMNVPARRDPFVPQIVPDAAPAQPERARSSPAPRRPTANQFAGSVPPVNPFAVIGPGTLPSAAVVPEPDPDFVLTGIIRGKENVAIIRAGESGRYIVKQGQLIDGRYRVLSVSDNGAVLAYKKRRIHVRLGGV